MRITGSAQSEIIRDYAIKYAEDCLIDDYPELMYPVGVHFLKTVEPHYAAITKALVDSDPSEDGEKRAEIRKDDRGFAEGDFLCLERFPYDGRFAIAYVTHKLSSKDFPEGLVDGYCMLSVDVVEAKIFIGGMMHEAWRHRNG